MMVILGERDFTITAHVKGVDIFYTTVSKNIYAAVNND